MSDLCASLLVSRYLGDVAPRLAGEYEAAHGGAGKARTIIGLDFADG